VPIVSILTVPSSPEPILADYVVSGSVPNVTVN